MVGRVEVQIVRTFILLERRVHNQRYVRVRLSEARGVSVILETLTLCRVPKSIFKIYISVRYSQKHLAFYNLD